MNTLEPAQIKNINKYMQIIDDAKAFQKEQGFLQWTEDYPNINIITEDIQAKKGYALLVDGEVAGYMCIDFSKEPAYENINGKWRSDEKYAVVHRMAFNKEFRGKGLAAAAFGLIEKFCLENNINYIRIDTDFQNERMRHVLVKNGFSYCGTINFQGSDKLAYDKFI